MEKEITYKQNENTLNALQKTYDGLWDKFFYGDKESGTRPGNIEVYGVIRRTREVAKGRIALREQMLSGGEKEQ